MIAEIAAPDADVAALLAKLAVPISRITSDSRQVRQGDAFAAYRGTQQDGRAADEDTAQDIADRAASSYTKEFLFHQSNNDRQLLQMVEGALARIREGNFGECISCGKEINPKRLEAVPWTRHCIECQEKLEQGILEETST